MTVAFVCVALLSWVAAFVLWLRVRAAESEVDAMAPPADDATGTAVRSALAAYLAELAPGGDHRGLEAIPVRAREPHDRERTVGDLVARIAHPDPPASPAAHEERMKSLLLLAHTLDLDAEETASLTEPARDAMIGADWLGRKVARADTVARGAVLDRETMWPLSSGTRVRVPLGVVIRDEHDKVLSRAKVYCR